MKKLIIVLLLLVSILSTQSQTKFKFGVRTGINISDYTSLDTKKRLNFYLGGSLSIKFAEFYTMQPEITYSRQGAVYRFDNQTDFDLFSDYISTGVINKFRITSKIKALAGPYLDIRINEVVSREEYHGGFFSFTNDIVLFTPIDVGVTLGMDYEIDKNLLIEIRLKQGTIGAINQRYFDSSNGNNSETNNLTQVFQIGATYKFNF